ncbi:MAG: hypothetical protein EOM30_11165 [Clostridia bacterium]|nr:hypothetical protein [Clostridia bacterium]NLS86061.1 hypothetical protein [Oscillospiraceae bacterium]
MRETYVTVTGFDRRLKNSQLAVGNVLYFQKDIHGTDLIKCTLPNLGTFGYIARVPQQIVGGTNSAGRIYDRVPDTFTVRIYFSAKTQLICKIIA